MNRKMDLDCSESTDLENYLSIILSEDYEEKIGNDVKKKEYNKTRKSHMKLDVTTLIDLVKRHNFLYDRRSEQYKDIAVKSDAWHEIGSKMGVDAKACLNRWSSIRRAYSNWKKKQSSNQGKGMKMYKYAPQLVFLDDKRKHCAQFKITPTISKLRPKKAALRIKRKATHEYGDSADKGFGNDPGLLDILTFFQGLGEQVAQLPVDYRLSVQMACAALVTKAEWECRVLGEKRPRRRIHHDVVDEEQVGENEEAV